VEFSGQVAVITGGSGALGSALCHFFAERGAKVAVLCRSNKDGAEALAGNLRDKGAAAQAFEVDVASRTSVDAAFADVRTAFGGVDILINCAGISRSSMVWKVSEADWSSTIDTNLTGAFECTRAVLPSMRANGRGRIINISSVVGQIGVPGTVAYAASKAGIGGLTRGTAVEVANKGITVNALALGYFDAGIISHVPPDMLGKIVGAIPVGRLGRPDELTHLVGFLCSDFASYITGQTINVNGGLYLG
jgi:3-oxoacyl-[acyl-carrier protein] reductase